MAVLAKFNLPYLQAVPAGDRPHAIEDVAFRGGAGGSAPARRVSLGPLSIMTRSLFLSPCLLVGPL